MRKLVLFDLDGTLIDSRCEPMQRLMKSHVCLCVQGVFMWVYARPYVAEVLLAIRRMGPDVALSLYSAGSWEYVHEVLDKALLPLIAEHPLAKTVPFYFDRIYTRDDLDIDGVKRVDDAMEYHDADATLLVDDSSDQCLYADAVFGEYAIHIKTFDASAPESENDRCLLDVLDHDIFRLISCFSRDTPKPRRRPLLGRT